MLDAIALKRLIAEVREDHESLAVDGDLICADCERKWPCPAARAADELEQIQASQ